MAANVLLSPDTAAPQLTLQWELPRCPAIPEKFVVTSRPEVKEASGELWPRPNIRSMYNECFKVGKANSHSAWNRSLSLAASQDRKNNLCVSSRNMRKQGKVGFPRKVPNVHASSLLTDCALCVRQNCLWLSGCKALLLEGPAVGSGASMPRAWGAKKSSIPGHIWLGRASGAAGWSTTAQRHDLPKWLAWLGWLEVDSRGEGSYRARSPCAGG